MLLPDIILGSVHVLPPQKVRVCGNVRSHRLLSAVSAVFPLEQQL